MPAREPGSGRISIPKTALVVAAATALMVLVASVVVAGKETETACDANVEERRAWIDAKSSLLEGYPPATFGMAASGRCNYVLRVHEQDCSIGYLLAAYGRKPFMQRARDLGFDKLSCGFDEYDMAVIVGR